MKPRIPLGKLLVDGGYIDDYQYRSAVGHQRRYGGKFATVVHTLGFVPERTLLILLARQTGYPAVELRRSVLRVANTSVLPRELAERHQALPLLVERDRVLVALADPTDVKALDEIRFVVGKRIVPHIALHGLLVEAIRGLYSARTTFWYGEDADTSVSSEQGKLEIVTPQTPLPPPPPRRETVSAAGLAQAGAAPPEDEPTDSGLWSAPFDPRAAAAMPPRPAPAPAPTPVPSRAEGAPPLVLVADPDAEFVARAQAALQQGGFSPIAAKDGASAVQALRERSPDVVALEVLLPDVPGLEICQKLRASQRFSQTPVILLSSRHRGDGYRRDVQALYRVDAVLEKPFPLGLLVRRVEELLVRAKRIPPRIDPARARAAEAHAQGVQLLSDGRIDEAIEVLRRGAADDPFSPDLQFQLGTAYRRKSMDLAAVAAFESAIELRADFYAALQSLAVLYQEHGFKRKSFELWERAHECCPEPEMRGRIREHLREYFR